MKISIKNWGSISPLGTEKEKIWKNYLSDESWIKEDPRFDIPTATISKESKETLQKLIQTNKTYSRLDDSVIYAMYAAEQAIKEANWKNKSFGINIGSSRGATRVWEKNHAHFLNKEKISLLTSPTTTLGNLSSWVGQHLNQRGWSSGHSVTCSTALHSIINGVVWLKSGMQDRFLAGGTEAPLTSFTLQQMKELRIYGKEKKEGYYCRPFAKNASNGMILGEGAAVFCLEKQQNEDLPTIEGVGFFSEKIASLTSISKEGIAMYQSMKMAMGQANILPDLIIAHAPGTKKGDASELKAIRQLFPKQTPIIFSNKWKTGHTLGASGAFSLELALLILKKQGVPRLPYPNLLPSSDKQEINSILINAAGFGGNAASILIQK